MGGVSSELYGYYEGQGGKGGRQGEAVVEAMKKWGETEAGMAGGTELGFAVCKRGFRPFGEDGEGLYGCARHTHMRLEAMQQPRPPPPIPANRRGKIAAAAAVAGGAGGGGRGAGAPGLYHRPGWERFDQWVFGAKICVSGEETSGDDGGEDAAASPTKAA